MESLARPGNEHPLRIRVAPEEVTVRYWGLRDAAGMTWFNLLLAAGASVMTAYTLGHAAWGWGTMVVLLITLGRSWLPIRYELGTQGITEVILGRTRRIAWTAVLNYQVYPHGVSLYPDAVITPLSPLRGLFVPFGSQREGVMANIDYYLASWAGSQNSTSH